MHLLIFKDRSLASLFYTGTPIRPPSAPNDGQIVAGDEGNDAVIKEDRLGLDINWNKMPFIRRMGPIRRVWTDWTIVPTAGDQV